MWFRAARPRQWPKNLLVALSAVTSTSFGSSIGIHLLVAFALVTAVAAGTYLVKVSGAIERAPLAPRRGGRGSGRRGD